MRGLIIRTAFHEETMIEFSFTRVSYPQKMQFKALGESRGDTVPYLPRLLHIIAVCKKKTLTRIHFD